VRWHEGPALESRAGMLRHQRRSLIRSRPPPAAAPSTEDKTRAVFPRASRVLV
jgi:hypothetical protein